MRSQFAKALDLRDWGLDKPKGRFKRGGPQKRFLARNFLRAGRCPLKPDWSTFETVPAILNPVKKDSRRLSASLFFCSDFSGDELKGDENQAA